MSPENYTKILNLRTFFTEIKINAKDSTSGKVSDKIYYMISPKITETLLREQSILKYLRSLSYIDQGLLLENLVNSMIKKDQAHHYYEQLFFNDDKDLMKEKLMNLAEMKYLKFDTVFISTIDSFF